MLEKNLRMEGQYPKPLDTWAGTVFDMAINLSGRPLPRSGLRSRELARSRPDRQRRIVPSADPRRDRRVVMRLIIASRDGQKPGTAEACASVEIIEPAATPAAAAPEPSPRRRKFLR